MKTNNKLKELFNKWAKDRDYLNFFRDGIMGEKEWSKRTPRIMYLLKENYSEGWNEINSSIDIRGGTNKKFFPNLARWKYLIENITLYKKILDFPSEKELVDFQKGWDLYDIAYVNVKKTRGSSKSCGKDIQNYAIKDRDFLKQEINIINPSIIICCKTFVEYNIIYNEKIEQVDERVYFHNNKLIIDFYHPGWWQCPGGQKGLYNKLRDILNKKNIINMITCQST